MKDQKTVKCLAFGKRILGVQSEKKEKEGQVSYGETL